MKKVLLINGSPRKNWNTHKLLMEAERGAQEMGAETKLVHLFDLNYSDCRSCFSCKIKGSKTNGICALRDDLRQVLEYAWDADAIIIGSPIYNGNLTSPVLAFKNRLIFPVIYYELDPETNLPVSLLAKPKKTGLIVSGNITADAYKNGYAEKFEQEALQLGWGLGSGEVLFVADTYQFTDYEKYHASMFDPAKKAEQREKQFPIDLQNAYDMGKRFAEISET